MLNLRLLQYPTLSICDGVRWFTFPATESFSEASTTIRSP